MPQVMNNPALTVRGVSKSFGATRALQDVSFEVRRGEIHALLGGNGSGKSTLIKILAGVLSADEGAVGVGSVVADATGVTPGFARAAGLRFVHQQSSTFEHLTVTENLFIDGSFGTAMGPIQWGRLRRETKQILARFEIDAAPNDELGSLGPATQTMVAIARALRQQGDEPGILVLDEPTASLPASEVERLLSALRRFASEGHSIIFVTHRLEEVLAAADTITILRDGMLVKTIPKAQTDHGGLVELILGRKLNSLAPAASSVMAKDELLTLEAVAGGPVREMNLQVRRGEVVGLAGLTGSGRSSVLHMVFGTCQPASGNIRLEGQPVSFRSPAAAMRAGVGLVPENRAREAAFSELSISQNMSMAVIPSYFRVGALRRRRELADSRALSADFFVKSAGPSAPLSSLSGGNQQKVVLARWLRRDPSLLLLDEPTQGVDVGAKFEIWELIRRQVERGMGVLVASSDFEELAAACDRVLVVREGRVVAEVSGAELTDSNLEHLTLESA